jgi:hypothetical protein
MLASRGRGPQDVQPAGTMPMKVVQTSPVMATPPLSQVSDNLIAKIIMEVRRALNRHFVIESSLVRACILHLVLDMCDVNNHLVYGCIKSPDGETQTPWIWVSCKGKFTDLLANSDPWRQAADECKVDFYDSDGMLKMAEDNNLDFSSYFPDDPKEEPEKSIVVLGKELKLGSASQLWSYHGLGSQECPNVAFLDEINEDMGHAEVAKVFRDVEGFVGSLDGGTRAAYEEAQRASLSVLDMVV